MRLGQLDPDTQPAWWVRDTRVDVTADGEIIYDPRLWWPMEMVKRVGMAWRQLRYVYRERPRRQRKPVGGKVRTYSTSGYGDYLRRLP